MLTTCTTYSTVLTQPTLVPIGTTPTHEVHSPTILPGTNGWYQRYYSSVLDSGVVTVLVCFAEDPGALHSSRPAVHHDLVQAWAQIYPDEMVACGYITKEDRDRDEI